MTEKNKDNLFQMGSAEMGKVPMEVLSVKDIKTREIKQKDDPKKLNDK